MTIENYFSIANYWESPKPKLKNIGIIHNKILVKVLKSYKYINFSERYYEQDKYPNNLTCFIDWGGIDYGWFSFMYKKARSNKELKKYIINFIMGFHKNEEVYCYERNGVVHYLWLSQKEILEVKLSNNSIN